MILPRDTGENGINPLSQLTPLTNVQPELPFISRAWLPFCYSPVRQFSSDKWTSLSLPRTHTRLWVTLDSRQRHYRHCTLCIAHSASLTLHTTCTLKTRVIEEEMMSILLFSHCTNQINSLFLSHCLSLCACFSVNDNSYSGQDKSF